MNIRQSLRIIFRNKTYSILNIFGLTIGITSAALIFLWVEHMVNQNRAIPDSENIYMVGQHQYYGNEIHTFFVASGPLPETLNNEFPEIKCNTRLSDRQYISFVPENSQNTFVEPGYYADSTFLRMISVEFLRGNAQTAFNAALPIVISENMAEKLFGREDPIGKIIKTEDRSYEVTGVFKNNPKNTSFQFEWLVPFRILERHYLDNNYVNIHWRANWFSCYVAVMPNTDIDAINKKLAKLIPDRIPGDKTAFFIYPINKQRLYGEFRDGMETGGGYIRTVRLFFVIGLVILLIACINFMNLSTARSQKRALEVGVRKTFGAKRKDLIQLFLKESGLITCISLFISVGLIYLVLPAFNTLVSRQLFIDWTNLYIWGGLTGIGLLCSFLAGSYPAFYLSSFSPLATLKKQKAGNTGHVIWVRQGLVVFQFSIAFILICSTFAIFRQIQFGQQRDLGMNKENLVFYPATNEIKNSHETIKNQLLNSGFVENAGLSSHTLLTIWSNGGGYQWQGKDPDNNPLISITSSTPGLIETVGMKMVEGAHFSSHHIDGNYAIINQRLAEMMGAEGRIGGKIGQSGNPEELEIIGIVKDFIFNNIYKEKPEPLLILCYASATNHLFIRHKPGVNQIEATAKIKEILQSFSPNTVFEPTYMENHFDNMFYSERLESKLSLLFAGLAIFISCLGLFGLSAFSAEQRRKEIGIRKVLGASIPDILTLLGKNYMILTMISFIIGVPVAWYITNRYLQDYAYRISLGWTLFAEVALLVTLIAMLTVSFQSLRAATANPVKSIKSE